MSVGPTFEEYTWFLDLFGLANYRVRDLAAVPFVGCYEDEIK